MSIQSISNLVSLNKNNEHDLEKIKKDLINYGFIYEKDNFSEHFSDIQTSLKHLFLYSIEKDLISSKFSDIDSLSYDTINSLNYNIKKVLFYTSAFYYQLNKK